MGTDFSFRGRTPFPRPGRPACHTRNVPCKVALEDGGVGSCGVQHQGQVVSVLRVTVPLCSRPLGLGGGFTPVPNRTRSSSEAH